MHTKLQPKIQYPGEEPLDQEEHCVFEFSSLLPCSHLRQHPTEGSMNKESGKVYNASL